jgi:RNA polymerase sigma-70 factor (ECF subfamily)
VTLAVARTSGFEGPELVSLIPHMRSFARSLCHDIAQAEDLAQDALANAWRHRTAFAPGTNLKSWVFRILRNRFYSDYRRAWRVQQIDSVDVEQTLVAVFNPEDALELDDVRRAMLELSDKQREALTLVGVAGLSYEEAAAICDCAEGTIKSRVCRARQQLLSILSRETPSHRRRVAGDVMSAMITDAEQMCSRRHSRPRSQPSEITNAFQ